MSNLNYNPVTGETLEATLNRTNADYRRATDNLKSALHEEADWRVIARITDEAKRIKEYERRNR